MSTIDKSLITQPIIRIFVGVCKLRFARKVKMTETLKKSPSVIKTLNAIPITVWAVEEPPELNTIPVSFGRTSIVNSVVLPVAIAYYTGTFI